MEETARNCKNKMGTKRKWIGKLGVNWLRAYVPAADEKTEEAERVSTSKAEKQRLG